MFDSNTFSLAEKIWNYLHLNQPLQKANCIIDLGSYDLRVAERCAELYCEMWAPLVVFSGGLGNWTRNLCSGRKLNQHWRKYHFYQGLFTRF